MLDFESNLVKKPIYFYIEGWGTCRSQEPAENILINVRSTASISFTRMYIPREYWRTYSSAHRAVSGFSVAFRLVDSSGPPRNYNLYRGWSLEWRNFAQSAIIIVNIVFGSLIQVSPLCEGHLHNYLERLTWPYRIPKLHLSGPLQSK